MNPTWQAYKEAGFAGLVACCFGILLLNQNSSFNDLMKARETDVANARVEREKYATESWNQVQSMMDRAERNEAAARDREDKQREKMWIFTSIIKDWLKEVAMQLRIALTPDKPVPKKENK